MRISTSHIFATVALLMFAGCHDDGPTVDAYSELHDIHKLRLAQITVAKAVKITDSRLPDDNGFLTGTKIISGDSKGGTRIAVYSFDTHVNAHVDMSALKPSDVKVDDNARTLHLTLPPVEVVWDGGNVNYHQDHYRITSLKASINSDERTRLKNEIGQQLHEELKADPRYAQHLKEVAQKKAVAYFSDLISGWGYSPTIEVRD